MPRISSLKEIRDSVLDTTQQENAQIGSLVNGYVNLTLREIESPGWCFSPRREKSHFWSWLKHKTSFNTVASTAEYVLERDIRHIALVRQEETPIKLTRMTDEDFYEIEPEPDSSGNPEIYRVWEVSGVKTKLSTADTIDVVSSSTSDANDDDLTVTVYGYVNNILQSESYTLNGTTTVSGSTTFDARDVFVSKSKDTAGTITLTENSGSTTLTTMGKEERNPIHKVLSLYPIPSSAITVYVEYYGHMRELTNDGDVPMFDSNWHYIVRLGVLAKVYQHLGKETDFMTTQALYSSSVRSMVNSDSVVSDLIPKLKRHYPLHYYDGYVKRSDDDVA